jgi:putative membrane protein
MSAIDPELVRAVETAIRDVERQSSAELVVEVRARSGSYAAADGRAGALVAFVGLLVLLFSPWPIAAGWVAFDVAVLYAIGYAISWRSSLVRRWFTSASERRSRVRTAAAALFYERGIANTRAETGVLLYLSLLERRLELIADRGVLNAVPSTEWNQLVALLGSDQRGDVRRLVEVLEMLRPILADRLPAGADNPDELASEPRFDLE